MGTNSMIFDIQVVADIQRVDKGAKLLFHNGLAATLPAQQPDYDLILPRVESSRRERQPVGIVYDADGRLVTLNHAYPSTVRCARDDDEDSNRVMVEFWGFSAICYLTRDHPEFERIRTTLAEAAATGATVWLANWPWPVEGETEIWNKLMDVRPELAPVQARLWREAPPSAANGAPAEARSTPAGTAGGSSGLER
jgi:hypothetical protein